MTSARFGSSSACRNARKSSTSRSCSQTRTYAGSSACPLRVRSGPQRATSATCFGSAADFEAERRARPLCTRYRTWGTDRWDGCLRAGTGFVVRRPGGRLRANRRQERRRLQPVAVAARKLSGCRHHEGPKCVPGRVANEGKCDHEAEERVAKPSTIKPAIRAAHKSIGPILRRTVRTLVAMAVTASTFSTRSKGGATAEMENTIIANTALQRAGEEQPRPTFANSRVCTYSLGGGKRGAAKAKDNISSRKASCTQKRKEQHHAKARAAPATCQPAPSLTQGDPLPCFETATRFIQSRREERSHQHRIRQPGGRDQRHASSRRNPKRMPHAARLNTAP